MDPDARTSKHSGFPGKEYVGLRLFLYRRRWTTPTSSSPVKREMKGQSLWGKQKAENSRRSGPGCGNAGRRWRASPTLFHASPIPQRPHPRPRAAAAARGDGRNIHFPLSLRGHKPFKTLELFRCDERYCRSWSSCRQLHKTP